MTFTRNLTTISRIMLLSFALLISLSIIPAFSAEPLLLNQDTWVTNQGGSVHSLAATNDTLYLGGEFQYMGPNTGAAALINQSTGMPGASLPRIAGIVYAACSDGAGGWFVGGTFTRVGSTDWTYLAHIKSTGRLDPKWNARLDGPVFALALSGNTLYVGGNFAHASSKIRNHAAAFDVSSAELLTWNPNADGTVWAIAVSDAIFLGGSFRNIGGQTRSSLAAIHKTTGEVEDWNARISTGYYDNVFRILPDGNTLYICGRFTTIGEKNRSNIAAIAIDTAIANDFNPAPNEFVEGMAIRGSVMFFSGGFSMVGATERTALACANLTNGAVTSWNPNLGSASLKVSHAVAVSDSTVYVGGIAGEEVPQGQMNAYDAVSGAVKWSRYMDGDVLQFMNSGSELMVTGSFNSLGGEMRQNIAAIDTQTGKLRPWNPGASASVDSLAIAGSTVYAGGNFDMVGGKYRYSLASIGAVTGEVSNWNPNASNGAGITHVYSIIPVGQTIYAAGDFDSIGSKSCQSIAAIDAATGALKTWDAGVASGMDMTTVYTMAISGSKLYAGGNFTTLGGKSRRGLGAISLTSGTATSWNPTATDTGNVTIRSLALYNSKVYVGGKFSSIGGKQRSNLAAFSASNGQLTSWDPQTTGTAATVYSLAIGNGSVYAGGSFSQANGQTISRLAQFDLVSGTARTWQPNPDDKVLAILPRGSYLWIGGAQLMIGGGERPGLALYQPTTSANEQVWQMFQ